MNCLCKITQRRCLRVVIKQKFVSGINIQITGWRDRGAVPDRVARSVLGRADGTGSAAASSLNGVHLSVQPSGRKLTVTEMHVSRPPWLQ